MGQRGILRTFLTTVLLAIIIFFIIYFFVPAMSMQYFGVSFSLREGSINERTLSTIKEEYGGVELGLEGGQRLWKEMNSREFRQRFKLAAQEGEHAIRALVSDLVDRIR